MKITVGELMDTLQHFDEEAEVRIAEGGYRSFFEYGIEDIVEAEDSDGKDVVYIGEGRQLGYLPSDARQELCW